MVGAGGVLVGCGADICLCLLGRQRVAGSGKPEGRTLSVAAAKSDGVSSVQASTAPSVAEAEPLELVRLAGVELPFCWAAEGLPDEPPPHAAKPSIPAATTTQRSRRLHFERLLHRVVSIRAT